MALEMLIRLIKSNDRLPGDVIFVKPYPNSGWGSEEGPPTFGVLRILGRNYEDFQSAYRPWNREAEITMSAVTSKDVAIVVKENPTQAKELTLLELSPIVSDKGTLKNEFVDYDKSLNFTFSATDEEKKEQFLMGLYEKCSETLSNRRFRVENAVIEKLKDNKGFLEVDDIAVLDLSVNKVVDSTG